MHNFVHLMSTGRINTVKPHSIRFKLPKWITRMGVLQDTGMFDNEQDHLRRQNNNLPQAQQNASKTHASQYQQMVEK